MKQSLTISGNESVVSRNDLHWILLMVLTFFAVCYIGISIYKAVSVDDVSEKPRQGERPNLPDDKPVPIAKPDTDDDDTKRKYVTYTKYNPLTEQYYVGKSSGYSTPEQIVRKRDYSHHRNAEGYLPAVLDRWSFNYQAIRGREQQIIDLFGGAWSEVGRENTKSGNKIRGISKKNFTLSVYIAQAINVFGIPNKNEIMLKHNQYIP